jgi:cyclopropane fatty-acyl-phospholipid synthase-like methyltransferase
MSERKDLELIADLVPAGSRVLDLGCGNGELLAWLQSTRAAAATASRSTTPTCTPACSAASTSSS